MKPRLLGGGGSSSSSTFLSACLISACQALQSCGGVQCVDGQRCCPPVAPGNGSAAVRCCKLPIHVFFDNVGWVTRKLSGILILLLLFAMGYFIQRIICPRPRRHQNQEHRGEEPSLFHGRASASQDFLLDQYPEPCAVGDFASPNLPAYDEVKHLPTYEESMQELHRDRSDEHLLLDTQRTGEEGTRTGPRSGERRPDHLQETSTQRSPRTARNSV